MNKAGLWQKVSEATLQTQTSRLKKCRFAIFDLSDIQKEYAEKMEGLARVYDGSKGEIANGYWLCNVTTVNDVASTIIPAWSELFSHEAEVTSENKKILSAADTVLSFCAADAISIFDRGGDRATLIHAFLENDKAFIIRQTGKRHLVYNGEQKSLKAISGKAKLRWAFKVERIHKNKVKRRMYNCGAVPVQMPNDRGHRQLWPALENRRSASPDQSRLSVGNDLLAPLRSTQEYECVVVGRGIVPLHPIRKSLSRYYFPSEISFGESKKIL